MGSVVGENLFYRETFRYKTRRVAMLLNIVLTPDKPTPKSNFTDGN